MITIVNTHPAENAAFTDGLSRIITELGLECRVISGYEGTGALQSDDRVILSGVPLDVKYSLEDVRTQREIDRAFAWLRDYQGAVLGICFGHEVLAHIFGGDVASLARPVKDPRYRLRFSSEFPRGIFSGIDECGVFAEHLQYVSAVPEPFNVLSQKDGIPYVMYHPGREFYGVQFVPERSDSRCKDALRRFVSGRGG